MHRLARHVAGAVQRQILAAETGADRAVFQHRHIGERLHDLMGAREPVAGDDKGPFAGDVDAVEHDLAGIRRKHAVDQIEQRRFAGAVRPDQAEDFARLQDEAQIVHRLQAAEALADAVELEQRRHSSTRFNRGKRL